MSVHPELGSHMACIFDSSIDFDWWSRNDTPGCVKISISPRKIVLKGRDPSSAMGFRGCAYANVKFTREIYFRLLIRLLLSQHTDVR